jgi:hypothetical protein
VSKIRSGSNLDFLRGVISGLENKLLNTGQLELLQEIRDRDEFEGLISGTVFHPLLKDFLESQKAEDIHQKGGTYVRQFLILEPQLLFLAFVNRVTEAYRLLWLNPDIPDERIFGCGMYAIEMRQPENLSLPELEVLKDWLQAFKLVVSKADSFASLERGLFLTKRKIIKEIAALYGRSLEELIDNLNLIEDASFIVAAFKFKQQVDEKIASYKGVFAESIENLLNQKFDSEEAFLLGLASLKFDQPALYHYLNFFFGANSLFDLQTKVESLRMNVLLSASYDILSPVYPYVYFQVFSSQLEAIIRAYVNLHISLQKEVAFH